MNIEEVKVLASRFRIAIQESKNDLLNWKEEKDFRTFPKMCCGAASHLLGLYLVRNEGNIKVEYIQYVDNYEPPKEDHAWLEVTIDGATYIIDITNDQLGQGLAPVFIQEKTSLPLDEMHQRIIEEWKCPRSIIFPRQGHKYSPPVAYVVGSIVSQ